MSIEDKARGRGIKDLVHFTTNQGLLGILSMANLLPRSALLDEQGLEYILKVNSKFRSDVGWLDYVNFSISRMNYRFFEQSGAWHTGVFWVLLSFDSILMSHRGVHFTSTNNIYPSCLRGSDDEAFEAMFAPVVLGRYSEKIQRTPELPQAWTTCPQAEVLYPGPVSLEHLKEIYVRTEEDQHQVSAMLAAVGARPFPVILDSTKFAAPRPAL